MSASARDEKGRPTVPTGLYGGQTNGRRVTVRDLAAAKERGEKWPMLTAYDALTARVFDDAGIPVLLVGDSGGMVVLGYDSTIPVTVDELLPLTAAVVRGTSRALVVADMPFGSYQTGPEEALRERGTLPQGGRRPGDQARGRRAGAPAGRGTRRGRHPGHGAPRPDAAVGERLRRLPRPGPRRVRRAAHGRRQGAGGRGRVLARPRMRAGRAGRSGSPTRCRSRSIGIGAGPSTDAQVLVWQDMAGLTPQTAKFVKRYADVAGVLRSAVEEYASEVVSGEFPAAGARLPLSRLRPNLDHAIGCRVSHDHGADASAPHDAGGRTPT